MKQHTLLFFFVALGLSACDCLDCAPSVFNVNVHTVYIYDGPTEGSYTFSGPIRLTSSYNWVLQNNAPNYISASPNSGIGGAHFFDLDLSVTVARLVEDLDKFEAEGGHGYRVATLTFAAQQHSQLVKVYYRPTINLAFDANGGGENPASQSGRMYDCVNLPEQSAAMSGPNTYSVLAGWSEYADGSDPVYPAGEAYTLMSSTTLYAVWESNPPVLTVNYHANYPMGTMATREVKYFAIGDAIAPEVLFDAPDENYDFYGWKESAGGAPTPYYAPGASLPNPDCGSLDLYAGWTNHSGTVENPILIYNEEELRAMKDGLGKHYLLMDDIVLTATWIPIGKDASSPFTGSFDGNGKTISNLSVAKMPLYSLSGLFGYIKSGEGNMAVQNLCVELGDAGLHGTRAGGIVGQIESGNILDCAVSGKAITGFYNGGIAGHADAKSSIQNCSSAVSSIHSENKGTVNAGGIVGYAYGRVENCYATGDVSVTLLPGGGLGALIYAGGIAGRPFEGAIIKNCYATGMISASGASKNYAGGIVGLGGTKICVENCVALNSEIAGGPCQRVCAFGVSTTLINNYGSSNLVYEHLDAVGGWINNAAGLDGADCAAVPTAAWWTGTALWDETVWVFADGALPRLRNEK